MLPMQFEPVAAVLPPALAATVICLLLVRTRRELPHGAPVVAGWEGMAVATALALVVWLLRGWLGFPPSNVHGWPLFVALAAIIPAALAQARLRWLMSASILLVVGFLRMLLTVPMRSWTAMQAAGWTAVFGLVWIALIPTARATAVRLPGVALAGWAGALAVTAYIIADPVTAKHHGYCLAGLGVAAGLTGLARLRWGERIRPASVAVAIAAIVPALLLLAHVMTDNLPASGLVPLIVAPFAPWLAWPLRHRPWTAAITAFLLAGAIAATAMLMVTAPEPQAMGW
jgi:hypothetical protein